MRLESADIFWGNVFDLFWFGFSCDAFFTLLELVSEDYRIEICPNDHDCDFV